MKNGIGGDEVNRGVRWRLLVLRTCFIYVEIGAVLEKLVKR